MKSDIILAPALQTKSCNVYGIMGAVYYHLKDAVGRDSGTTSKTASRRVEKEPLAEDAYNFIFQTPQGEFRTLQALRFPNYSAFFGLGHYINFLQGKTYWLKLFDASGNELGRVTYADCFKGYARLVFDAKDNPGRDMNLVAQGVVGAIRLTMGWVRDVAFRTEPAN